MGGSLRTDDLFLDPDEKVDIPDLPQGKGVPQLAKRNNNPGNLRFAGQRGAEPGDGGFARFKTPEDGYLALIRQVRLDQSRRLKLGEFVSKYAPPHENDTETYLKQASESLGVSPEVPIDSIDPEKIARFMAFKESKTSVKSLNESSLRASQGRTPPKTFDTADLFESTPKPVESSWRRIGNTLNNLQKTAVVARGLGTEQENQEVAAAMAQQSLATGAEALVDNVVKFGKWMTSWTFNEDVEGAKRLYEDVKKGGFINAVGMIPEMALGFFTAPIQTFTGLQYNEKELRATTAQERASAIQQTVGMVVGLGAAKATSNLMMDRSFNTAMSGISRASKIDDVFSTGQKWMMQEGALMTKVKRGLVEGAVGGVAEEAVASLGEDTYGANILLNVFAAPLGVAFETLRGIDIAPRAKKINQAAYDLAKTRILNIGSDDSFLGIVGKMEGFETADNIAQAIVRHKLLLNPGQHVVVPGVSTAQMQSILSDLAKGDTEITPSFFSNGDETYDVLLANRDRREPKLSPHNPSKHYNVADLRDGYIDITEAEDYIKRMDTAILEVFGSQEKLDRFKELKPIIYGEIQVDDNTYFALEEEFNQIRSDISIELNNKSKGFPFQTWESLRSYIEGAREPQTGELTFHPSNIEQIKEAWATYKPEELAKLTDDELYQLFTRNVEAVNMLELGSGNIKRPALGITFGNLHRAIQDRLPQKKFDFIGYAHKVLNRINKDNDINNGSIARTLWRIADDYANNGIEPVTKQKPAIVKERSPNLTSAQKQAFVQTGFLPGERVSYNGVDYEFVGLSSDKTKAVIQEYLSEFKDQYPKWRSKEALIIPFDRLRRKRMFEMNLDEKANVLLMSKDASAAPLLTNKDVAEIIGREKIDYDDVADVVEMLGLNKQQFIDKMNAASNAGYEINGHQYLKAISELAQATPGYKLANAFTITEKFLDKYNKLLPALNSQDPRFITPDNFKRRIYEDFHRTIADKIAQHGGLDPRSVVRDDKGTPLLMMHGTSAVFGDFDFELLSKGGLLYGPGLYTSIAADVVGGIPGEGSIFGGGYAFKGQYPILGYAVQELETAAQNLDLTRMDVEGSLNGYYKDVTPDRMLMAQYRYGQALKAHEEAYKRVIEAAEKIAPNVRPMYLDIRNPFDINANYTFKQITDLFGDKLSRDSYDSIFPSGVASGQELYQRLEDVLGNNINVNEYLKSKGFDGITHIGGGRAGYDTYHRVYIAFDQNQVVEPFTARYLDSTPTKSFKETVAEYAKIRGFDEKQLPYLESYIGQELIRAAEEADPTIPKFTEIEDILKPEEIIELERERGRVAFGELVEYALSNNMYLVKGPDGFEIRDVRTQMKLAHAKTAKEVMFFIDKSGQADGFDLFADFDGGLPPGVVPPFKSMIPDDGGEPYHINPTGNLERFSDLFNSSMPNITNMRSHLIAIDNILGTDLSTKVHDIVIHAHSRYSAAIDGDMRELRKILDSNGRILPMTQSRREVLGGYIEAASPATLERVGRGGGLPMKPEEIEIGKRWAAENVDLSQLLNYTRRIREIEQNAKGDLTPIEQAEFIDAVKREYAHFDIKHLNVADEIFQLRKQSKLDIGTITRYANAITNEAVDRAEYIDLHKMTKKEVETAEQLVALLGRLGEKYGVDLGDMMQFYMPHARLNYEGDFFDSLIDFPYDIAGKEMFKNLMHRTNEVSGYDLDPFNAISRYIKNYHFNRHLREPQLQAQQALATAQNRAQYFGKVDFWRVKESGDRFMQEAFGNPGQHRGWVERVLGEIFVKMGKQLPQDVLHNAVTFILQSGEAYSQGAKPLKAGLRDVLQPMFMYYPRFGMERTMNVMRHAFGKGSTENIAALVESGAVPEFKLTTVASANPFQETGLGRSTNAVVNTITQASELAFKLSGQGAAYRRMAGGTYLETIERTSQVLQKLVREKISPREAFEKELKLQTYQRPIQQEFLRLVDQKLYEKASEFLARATLAEMNGLFVQGNRVGWTRFETGRLLGQFGQWSMWYRTYLQQMLTRGTVADRIGFLRRFALVNAGVYTAATMAGFDPSVFSTLSAWAFAGGPSVDAIKTLHNATLGYGPARTIAQYKMAKAFGYNAEEDTWGMPSLWLPFGGAARDVMRALDFMQDGETGNALMQAAGYRPTEPE